jgi:hypothetical protein
MKKATSIEMASVLGLYVKRWQRWAVAGLDNITTSFVCEQMPNQKWLNKEVKG